MPGSSRRRRRKAAPVDRTNSAKFTPAAERWMAERLAALEGFQATAPSGRREGNIPRAGSLPSGFQEEEPQQPKPRWALD